MYIKNILYYEYYFLRKLLKYLYNKTNNNILIIKLKKIYYTIIQLFLIKLYLMFSFYIFSLI